MDPQFTTESVKLNDYSTTKVKPLDHSSNFTGFFMDSHIALSNKSEDITLEQKNNFILGCIRLGYSGIRIYSRIGEFFVCQTNDYS